jgi:hypothetical protein
VNHGNLIYIYILFSFLGNFNLISDHVWSNILASRTIDVLMPIDKYVSHCNSQTIEAKAIRISLEQRLELLKMGRPDERPISLQFWMDQT